MTFVEAAHVLESSFPNAPRATEARPIEIAVLFTSEKATLDALRQTAVLVNSLNAHITLFAAQTVPYPLSLEEPPIAVDFTRRRLMQLAAKCSINATAKVHLCRLPWQTIANDLAPGTLVVVGGRKRWWPTWERSLRLQLQRAGYPTILFESR